MGARPALPSNRLPLPGMVTDPQKVLLSRVELLPETRLVPSTRLKERLKLLPGTDRLPVIRAPRTRLSLPLTVTLPLRTTEPPAGPSPKRVTRLPEKVRLPV